MSESESSITPKTKKDTLKKPRHLSKKEGRELMAAIIEEHTTTPETDPQEALRRIKTVTGYILKSQEPIITQAYDEILRRSGRDPKEWIRYPGVPQPKNLDAGFTDQDMEGFVARYPRELEFFVTQGQPSARSQVDIERNGQAPYGMIDHFWTAYVRRRPDNPRLK